jgi:hypothetical protein
MPDLQFEIISAEVKPYAAVPTLAFYLQIKNGVENEQVYAVALKCQLMIEAVKRRYNEDDKNRLYELFGDHTRWDETLRTIFWQIINVPVPSFMNKTVIEINVPCSEELRIAAGKYFYAVREGSVPLNFLFSGTLFYQSKNDELQISLIPWEKEARYQMPTVLWQTLMDSHFPGSRWLQIHKDVYEKLVEYKSMTKYATIEDCLENILQEALLNGVENKSI